MSTTYIIVVFLAIIALLVFLVAKVKLHAIPALFFVTILLGLLIGTPIADIPGLINKGFGDTCKSVGIIIILGALLGEILSATGGVAKITHTFVKWFGEKRVLWAIGISCYIMGIPIFPDTVSLLVIPICTALSAETGISMMAFAATVGIGVTTSSLVPPTPGPVAAAALLGLPLGQAIPWGVLVSIPGLVATVLYANTLKKHEVPLNEDYLQGAHLAEDQMPSFSRSIAPILVPILLIVAYTVIDTSMPGTPLANFMKFIGEPISALTIGCLLAIFLQVKEWWNSKDVKSGWIDKACLSAAGPVFITALGGSLAAFIKNAGVAEMIADMIVKAHIPGIFVPMIIACLIRTITGSNTLGVTTAAALAQPMLDTLGLTPLSAYLAMCAGAVFVSHANSSGFWLVGTMCRLNVKDSFRAVSGASALSGIFCSLTVIILYFLHII